MIYFLIFINCGNIAYILCQYRKLKSERKEIDIEYIDNLIDKALNNYSDERQQPHE